MRLSEWVEREGPGALTRLVRATGLAYTTVFAAAKNHERAASYETAKKLSEATAGAVSVAEICEPVTQRPKKRAKR